MIRYLLFDIDDTLLNFRDQSEAVIQDTLAEFGLHFSDEQFAVYHRINNDLWNQVSNGTLSREGLYAIRWKRVLEALRLPGDGPAVEAQFRRLLNLSAVPEQGAAETLQALASRYTLCTASNAPQRQQELRLEKADLSRYFAHIFTSEGLGVDKPSPLFFERILEALGNPSRDTVMMLGDSPQADVLGAAAVGLRTCFVNLRGVTLPPDCTPDHTVTTLPDLRKFL